MIYIYGKVSEKRDLACIIKKHNKNALRLKCYNFRRVNAIVFLFSALHTTPFLYGKIHFGILNMLLASIAMSDTPKRFKPAITFCRSNQIASNSVCRWRGPVSIYLFCSLIFMQSVTEIQLNKLRAHFRARFAPMIWANCNVWGGGDYYIGANQAGKRARSLFNCISVTDGIKINEQNKSIGIGPLYLHSEFEAISLLLQKVMAGLNLLGVSNVAILARSKCKIPKSILP